MLVTLTAVIYEICVVLSNVALFKYHRVVWDHIVTHFKWPFLHWPKDTWGSLFGKVVYAAGETLQDFWQMIKIVHTPTKNKRNETTVLFYSNVPSFSTKVVAGTWHEQVNTSRFDSKLDIITTVVYQDLGICYSVHWQWSHLKWMLTLLSHPSRPTHSEPNRQILWSRVIN